MREGMSWSLLPRFPRWNFIIGTGRPRTRFDLGGEPCACEYGELLFHMALQELAPELLGQVFMVAERADDRVEKLPCSRAIHSDLDAETLKEPRSPVFPPLRHRGHDPDRRGDGSDQLGDEFPGKGGGERLTPAGGCLHLARQ